MERTLSEKLQAEREREAEFVTESAAPETRNSEGEPMRESAFREKSQEEMDTEPNLSAERAADGGGRVDFGEAGIEVQKREAWRKDEAVRERERVGLEGATRRRKEGVQKGGKGGEGEKGWGGEEGPFQTQIDV